jgi:hypothetical protein
MHTPCPESARVIRAVRHLLSEEISSSSSSLSSLSSDLKAHLATCASCAAEARALDPTLLFVPLAASVAAAPCAEDVRSLADDVLAEVRRRSRVAARPAARPFLSRRLLQVAALVALAAALFAVEGIRLVRQEQLARVAPVPVPDEMRDTRDTLDAFDTLAAARPPVRPLIQDLKNPGARVYEFAAVSLKEPSVVFIADPHADL